MTFAMLLPNITDAISNIAIAGVSTVDTDKIVASWQENANILYPNINPPGFITNTSIEYVTVLRGLDAPLNFHYTMNYRFLGTKLGDLTDIGLAYTNVMTKSFVIMEAIIDIATIYSGKVTIELGAFSFGMKDDPVGNEYHGADFEFHIMEMHP